MSEKDDSPPLSDDTPVVETPPVDPPMVQKPKRGRPPKILPVPHPPLTEARIKDMFADFKKQLEYDRLERKREKDRVKKMVREEVMSKYRDESRYGPPPEHRVSTPKFDLAPPPPLPEIAREVERKPDSTPIEKRKQFYKQRIFY